METNFLTITVPTEGSYREKGSKFLSFLAPCASEAQHRAGLVELRKHHPRAVHVCHAYRLRLGSELREFHSDDGEPSGSSGPPILNRLRKSKLQNVSLWVVRYFGGVKLGIPGLIRAYGAAAQAAMDQAVVQQTDISESFTLQCSYEELDQIMRLIDRLSVRILDQQYGAFCQLTVSIPMAQREIFYDQLQQQGQGISGC